MVATAELLLALVTPWLTTALLLALRLAPVVFVVPVLGGRRIPATARTGALLALVVTLAPGVGPTSSPSVPVLAAWQLLVGLAAGTAMVAFVAAMSAVGGTLDTAFGRGAFGGGGDDTGPLAHAWGLAFAAAFAATGGHLLVLTGLGESLAAVPLASVPEMATLQALGAQVVQVSQAALTAVVSLALPALIAGMLADLTLGWFNRAMPSLPAMFLAMPVRSVLGVLLAAALLGATIELGLQAVPEALEQTQRAVSP